MAATKDPVTDLSPIEAIEGRLSKLKDRPLLAQGARLLVHRAALGLPPRSAALAYWLAGQPEYDLQGVLERGTESEPIDRPAVASFWLYLLHDDGGEAALGTFVDALAKGSVEDAAQKAYGRDFAAITEDWMAFSAKQEVDKPGLGGVLRRTLSYWAPHKKLAFILLIMLAVQQAFNTGYALGLKTIIDNILKSTNDPPLVVVLAGLVVAFLFAVAASLYGERLKARISIAILNNIRQQMYEHLLHLASDFYGRTKSGDILSRFSGDIATLKKALTGRVATFLLSFVGLAINVPMLFVLDWRLALVTVVTLPIMIIVVGRLAPHAADAGYEQKNAEAGMMNTVQETVRAHALVKGFDLGDMLKERFRDELDELGRVSVRAEFLSELVGTVPGLGVLLIQLGITALGAWMAYTGRTTPGALVAFITLLTAVTKDAYALSKKVVPSLIKASSGIRRIEGLLEELPIVVEAENPEKLPRVKKAITFDDVGFSYTGEQANLQDLTLTIDKNTYVAFVGPSGSGKSTVLNLVTRFYDPTQGAVHFDGVDLRRGSLASLREQLGVVFQESFLFNTSIAENIRIANPDATQEEVVAAAKAAAIHDVIAKLPTGYDTLAGEGGGRLSGGQRQRIALARAMVRNPAVLVLDEATSALDPGTEAEINETVANLAKGRTVIAVTHRLAAITKVDRIFVMKDGRLEEDGTHDELLEKDGLYADLWAKQSGFEVAEDGRHARIEGSRLRQLPIFAGVEDEALLDALAKRLESEFHPEGTTLIEEDKRVHRLRILVRGRVDVLRRSMLHGQQRLATLEDGDAFGILPLVRDLPSKSTVVTASESLFVTMGRDELLEVMEEVPAVAEAVRAVKKAQYLDEMFGPRVRGSRPDVGPPPDARRMVGLS